MAKSGNALGIAAVAAILLFGVRSAFATPVYETDPEFNPEGTPDIPMGDLAIEIEPESVEAVSPIIANLGAPMTDTASLRAAFQYMLRSCEHRFPDDVVNDAAYSIFYGGSRFSDLSDHPVNTGEKAGVPLPPHMCVAAGYASGVCVSTAAGAYQFTRPTWNGLRAAGAWGPRLPDFSKESQDEAAIRLLGQIGALPLIDAGDFEGAIVRASKRWASLPGSTAKQGGHSLDYALARITESTQQA